MICSKCGANNENNSKFCFFCGNNMTPTTNNEPFIPRLDTDRVSMPGPDSVPMKSQYQPQQIDNPYISPPFYNQYGQPQIVGYDQNGMPLYSQPPPPPMYNQYGQPQIVGYDQNGMPLYSQPPPPPMYNQYGQPQIIGYDQNGMPLYSQPPPPPQPMYNNQYTQPQQNARQSSIPDIQAIPDINDLIPAIEEKNEEQVDISDDFWAFFDGGKSPEKNSGQSDSDFFGKSTHGDAMGDISTAGLDIDSLRHSEKKKNSYMGDTPVVDADRLEKYDPAKYNEMYMKRADVVNADDLGENLHRKVSDRERMATTKKVDAGRLSVRLKARPHIAMGSAGEANPDSLEAYVPEHTEALMAQAGSAVEAMPKRHNPYESEIDAIELPEYMQAKKTRKEEVIEIPSLPDFK